MSKLDVIRAWKDEEYFLSLSEAERALVPDNPAGLTELTDENLSEVAGGMITISWLGCTLDCTYGSCVTFCPVQSNVTFCPFTIDVLN